MKLSNDLVKHMRCIVILSETETSLITTRQRKNNQTFQEQKRDDVKEDGKTRSLTVSFFLWSKLQIPKGRGELFNL